MNFVISEDYGLIRSILTDAKCYVRMKNDTAPAIERFSVGPTPGVQFIIADGGGCTAAVFLLDVRDMPTATAEVHFCILPEWWGFSTQVSAEFLEWTWANTSLTHLWGNLPTYNMLAWHVAQSVGFTITGRTEDSVRKDGKMYALIHSECARPSREVANASTARP